MIDDKGVEDNNRSRSERKFSIAKMKFKLKEIYVVSPIKEISFHCMLKQHIATVVFLIFVFLLQYERERVVINGQKYKKKMNSKRKKSTEEQS